MGTDFDNERVSFTINVECDRYQIPRLISLLNAMQGCGAAGHSTHFLTYVDGDGSFRPKFTYSIDPGKTNEYKPINFNQSLYKKDHSDSYFVDMYFDMG